MNQGVNDRCKVDELSVYSIHRRYNMVCLYLVKVVVSSKMSGSDLEPISFLNLVNPIGYMTIFKTNISKSTTTHYLIIFGTPNCVVIK